MDIKVIEEQLLHAIEVFASLLPAEHAQAMRDLVHAGESGIAFENLCVDLIEYDVFPDEAMLTQLQNLGTAMKINPKYWERLTGQKYLANARSRLCLALALPHVGQELLQFVGRRLADLGQDAGEIPQGVKGVAFGSSLINPTVSQFSKKTTDR